MLLREQAIETFKKYVNKDNQIVFTFESPYQFIPQHENELENKMTLAIEEELFFNEVSWALIDFELPIEIVKQTDNKIIFKPKDKITYYYFIDKLERIQEQFDLENDGNMELNKFINTMNIITDLEIFLIEHAKMILEVKEFLDNTIKEYIENRKLKWEGENDNGI